MRSAEDFVRNGYVKIESAFSPELAARCRELLWQQLDELKTALAKAERDLAFTTVVAPIDGVFSNRMVNEGDYIQPGQRLANVVPLDDIYIDANFKETQLRRLKPGQPVDISVDANKDEKIEGMVASLAPASGSVFTLLPPDNATGNFTKIVQRVPVKIVLDDHRLAGLLRPGMSAEPTVDTKATVLAGREAEKRLASDAAFVRRNGS